MFISDFLRATQFLVLLGVFCTLASFGFTASYIFPPGYRGNLRVLTYGIVATLMTGKTLIQNVAGLLHVHAQEPFLLLSKLLSWGSCQRV